MNAQYYELVLKIRNNNKNTNNDLNINSWLNIFVHAFHYLNIN
jgi:hypothetical protein